MLSDEPVVGNRFWLRAKLVAVVDELVTAVACTTGVEDPELGVGPVRGSCDHRDKGNDTTYY